MRFYLGFHLNYARNSVKCTICRNISEIPLSRTLNPDQSIKQTRNLSLGFYVEHAIIH